MPVIPGTQRQGQDNPKFETILNKAVRGCLKNKIQNKKDEGVAQVIESLPRMCEVLGSIPILSPTKK
jgi:hypothetical protein